MQVVAEIWSHGRGRNSVCNSIKEAVRQAGEDHRGNVSAWASIKINGQEVMNRSQIWQAGNAWIGAHRSPWWSAEDRAEAQREWQEWCRWVKQIEEDWSRD